MTKFINTFDLLISTGTFYPDIGGPPTYLKNLAEQLHKEGAEIQVLTFGDPTPEQKKRLNYPTHYVTRFLPALIRIPVYTLSLFFKVLRSRHWYVNDYGMPAWLVSKITGKKYTLKIVGDFAWEWSVRHLGYTGTIDQFQLHRSHWLSIWVQLLQKTYILGARQVIVPSQYLKRILMGWGVEGTKIQVIYNAVQIQQPDTHQTIQLEKIASGETIFCTVARLVPWKGIDLVLQALAQIKNTEFKYLIVGLGPDCERLEKMTVDLKLQGKVFFLGSKSAAEISAILNRIKLFLLLSRYEGLPHVILEALSHRIPCLTSDVGGFPEVIISGNGMMMNLDQPNFQNDLKQILEEFISGQHVLNQLKPVLDEKFRFDGMVAKTKSMVMGLKNGYDSLKRR